MKKKKNEKRLQVIAELVWWLLIVGKKYHLVQYQWWTQLSHHRISGRLTEPQMRQQPKPGGQHDRQMVSA